MNSGFSNLTALKRHLLPTGMQPGTEYDAQILSIGKGVASRMEGYCNRVFARAVGEVYEFPGQTMLVVVPRFPLESVTKLEECDTLDTGWYDVTGNILNKGLDAGYIYFGGMLGVFGSRLRVTYTGGYWWDTTEDLTGTMPDGATELPDDLTLAWKLQCAHLWQSKDRLGAGAAKEPNKFSALGDYKLIPEVEDTLKDYIRFA